MVDSNEMREIDDQENSDIDGDNHCITKESGDNGNDGDDDDDGTNEHGDDVDDHLDDGNDGDDDGDGTNEHGDDVDDHLDDGNDGDDDGDDTNEHGDHVDDHLDDGNDGNDDDDDTNEHGDHVDDHLDDGNDGDDHNDDDTNEHGDHVDDYWDDGNDGDDGSENSDDENDDHSVDDNVNDEDHDGGVYPDDNDDDDVGGTTEEIPQPLTAAVLKKKLSLLPLYSDAPLSTKASWIACNYFSVTNNLSEAATKQLLDLIAIHCPKRDQCARSTYQLRKRLNPFDDVEMHMYCSECMKELKDTKKCIDRNCRRKRSKVCYLSLLPFHQHLSTIFSSRLYQLILIYKYFILQYR